MNQYSGGAIGAGLFVSSGGAFQKGGPASVLLGFMIVGTSPKSPITISFDMVANTRSKVS